jgi:GT2 family glycosyltransferase
MPQSESQHELCAAGNSYRELIHLLNRRYQEEFGRAERLQAELGGLLKSRAWKMLNCWARVKGWFKRPPQEDPVPVADCRTLPMTGLDATAKSAGRVSIIIPFKDRIDLLRGCLGSLRTSSYRRFELILVDNGSSERRTRRYLRRLQTRRGVRLVRSPGPFNFSRLCNDGADRAGGDHLLFLNNDTEVLSRDWLEQLLQPALHPEVGVVGATLLYPDGTIQHAGLVTQADGVWVHAYRGYPQDFAGHRGELHQVREVPAVTGACLLISRERFIALGGFDERFAGNLGDVDLCRRVREQGLRIVVTPHARLLHFESLSRGYQGPSQRELENQLAVGESVDNRQSAVGSRQ